MKKQIVTFMAFSSILFSGLSTFAQSNYYYNYNDYEQYETIENGDTYCTPKKGFMNKLKSAFAGQVTGFTPQLQPSPYLTPNYGPSYMQGYYSGNTWNSHNVYNPAYGGARLFGRSF